MFIRPRRSSHFFACGLACLLPLLAPAQERVKKLSDFQIGDIAPADIITPVELVVIDREASAALREKEAAKVPAFVRFDPRAADRAVADMRAALVDFREEFLITLEVKFGTRKLSAAQVQSPEFRNLQEVYRNLHQKFPLTLSLAAKWARGGDWAELETLFITRVRAAMTAGYIRADEVPVEAQTGPSHVRLLSLTAYQRAPDFAQWESDAQPVPRQDLVGVSKARNDFRASLTGEEKTYASFLAAFIQPNCVYEVALTRANRARKTDALWAADKFRAGDVIARAGEPISARTKAALDQLAAQSAVTELRVRDQRWERYWPWLAFAAGAGVVFVLVARFQRRPPEVEVLPGRALAGAAPTGLLAENSAASAPPGRTLARVESRPQLLTGLRDKFIFALLFQGRRLIATQQQAAAEIAALEERLEKIHAPLQERVKAYETRISELEQELAARTAENRELINATIALAKQRLEEEKSGTRVALN